MTKAEKKILMIYWDKLPHRWCSADRCGCLGCINRSARQILIRLIGRTLTQEEFEELKLEMENI